MLSMHDSFQIKATASQGESMDLRLSAGIVLFRQITGMMAVTKGKP
jgi:hypothetical protein